MSISHVGGLPNADPPVLPNKSSERTDGIVRQEIQDAYMASQYRSDKINIGKMMKIPLPEYSGGDSIDSFLRFLREILLYLVNYNVMGPDDDASRVGILGSTLKDRALKWYQHTIHLNADGSWTFETAMIELKRYFVKEASSRDAASKFDRLEQGNRTVMELRKDLERLSQLMVQPPTEYDMSRRFVDALHEDIAAAVVKYGLNPEKSPFELIFEKANEVEQGLFYEDRQIRHKRRPKPQDRSSVKTSSKHIIKKSSAGPKPSTSKTPQTGAKDNKSSGSTSKQIECFLCKQKGHYSNACPKKSRIKRAANVEAADEDNDEATANAADGSLSDSQLEEAVSGDEEEEEALEESSDEQSQDDEDPSLNDWAAEAFASVLVSTHTDSHGDYLNPEDSRRMDGTKLTDWSQTDGTVESQEESDTLSEIHYSSDTVGAACVIRCVDEDDEDVAECMKASGTNDDPVAYRQRGTKDLGPYKIEDGPKRDFKRLGVIEGFIRINGHKAHVLLDGGSTIDMISANFAKVHQLDVFQLKKPIKLQMATTGSRSSIQYGARANLKLGDLSQSRYFDVVNLDRYHAILGTPFLKEHEVLLNYAGNGSFKLKNRWFPVKDGDFGNPLSLEGERAEKPANKKKDITDKRKESSGNKTPNKKPIVNKVSTSDDKVSKRAKCAE